MFEEQVRTSGAHWEPRTATSKLQLVELPQPSLAVHVTMFVPIGKQLPLGGLQTTETGAPGQPPVAELL